MIVSWGNNKNNNFIIKDMEYNSKENFKYFEVEFSESVDIVNVFDCESIQIYY